ncbi:MAG: zinc ABC transporter solute-binding protein [Verrucomicrobia bacterium]|jgi:manganese/zinc/iron transport system substrate-binding protein|nr:zinc ABC transporter solute-binding protein [Verrucomicrobiota bacterium]
MKENTARNSVNGEAKKPPQAWRRWIWMAGALLLAGSPAWGQLRIVTTVGMVRAIAEEVAGPEAEVTGLMGSGVDPHLYKPTRGDVVALSQADVILYNGLHLEGRMVEIFARMERRDTPVLAVAEAALEEAGEAPLPGDDPHVWMDVSLWSHAVAAVAEFLAEVDEENAAGYAERAAEYRRRLTSLHAYGEEVTGSIPAGRRVLITAHDAFSYFGEAYGVEVRGIQGLSTESEAGVRDVERLLDSIVRRGIPAIFVEDSVSDKNVRALVEGARARGHDLRIGGTLYSDAMGPEGSYTGTYIGMLDHNLTTISRALGGSPPAGGFQGQHGKEN